MIKFYFTYQGTVVTLPVNPPELIIKKATENKTIEIVKLGQINLLRGVKLAEMEIKSFLPVYSNAPYVLTKSRFKDPSYYVNFFEQIMADRNPVELSIGESSIAISTSKPWVSIESFEYERHGGDSDVYYTLELRQYMPFQAFATQLKLVDSEDGAVTVQKETQREVTQPAPKTYTVAKNDRLWDIAKKCLGNGDKYKEIASLNGLSNPSLIYPGQVLQLP